MLWLNQALHLSTDMAWTLTSTPCSLALPFTIWNVPPLHKASPGHTVVMNLSLTTWGLLDLPWDLFTSPVWYPHFMHPQWRITTFVDGTLISHSSYFHPGVTKARKTPNVYWASTTYQVHCLSTFCACQMTYNNVHKYYMYSLINFHLSTSM